LGNLYNHFASKDELVAEIAQIEAADLTRLIADVTAGLSFEDFIPHYLKQVATPEHAILSIEILAAALRRPALATPFDANRKALINALSAHTKAKPAEIEIILDAVEALGMRCGLVHRKPKRAEIEFLRKMTATLT
jgi:AcrR family transcriptional regulator